MLCPICQEHNMIPREELNEVAYKNRYTKLKIEYSNCPLCGDQSDADQMKRNKQRMIEFKETVDLWTENEHLLEDNNG